MYVRRFGRFGLPAMASMGLLAYLLLRPSETALRERPLRKAILPEEHPSSEEGGVSSTPLPSSSPIEEPRREDPLVVPLSTSALLWILESSTNADELQTAIQDLVTHHAGDSSVAFALEQLYGRTPFVEVRQMAIWALGKCGRSDFLLWILRHEADERLRNSSVLALQGRPDEGLFLLAACDDPSPLVRSNALYALSDFARGDPALATAMAARCERPMDKSDRLLLLEALAWTESPQAQGRLLRALSDEDPSIRMAGAAGLRRMPDVHEDPTLRDAIEAALTKEPAEEVRAALANCLLSPAEILSRHGPCTRKDD